MVITGSQNMTGMGKYSLQKYCALAVVTPKRSGYGPTR